MEPDLSHTLNIPSREALLWRDFFAQRTHVTHIMLKWQTTD